MADRVHVAVEHAQDVQHGVRLKLHLRITQQAQQTGVKNLLGSLFAKSRERERVVGVRVNVEAVPRPLLGVG